MSEINSIVLDDGREYFIIDNVEVNNTTYTLFSDVENEKEIRIRKIVINDNKEYYVGLDSKEEYESVVIAFDKKINS